MRGEGAADVRKKGVATVTVSDNGQTITSKVDPWTGKHFLTATDTKTGKVLFDGPIDTPEERKAVPPQILKTWEALNIRMIMPGKRPDDAPNPPLPPGGQR
jgi:hypothetical protein